MAFDSRRGNQGGSWIAEANKRDKAVVDRMSESECRLTGQLIEARNERDLAIQHKELAEHRADRYLELLKAVEPHLDALICYTSTQGEHLPNKLVADIRKITGCVIPQAA